MIPGAPLEPLPTQKIVMQQWYHTYVTAGNTIDSVLFAASSRLSIRCSVNCQRLGEASAKLPIQQHAAVVYANCSLAVRIGQLYSQNFLQRSGLGYRRAVFGANVISLIILTNQVVRHVNTRFVASATDVVLYDVRGASAYSCLAVIFIRATCSSSSSSRSGSTRSTVVV